MPNTTSQPEKSSDEPGQPDHGPGSALPWELPSAAEIGKNMVVWSLVAGLIGGVLGGWFILRYGKSTLVKNVGSSQILVQEQSAVIDVAKKVSPSVVSITSSSVTTNFFGIGQTQQGSGTGIIVTSDGLIVTNKHVVPDGTSEVTVVTTDGKEYKNAKVVARDTTNDLAFVQVDAKGLTAADLGDSSAVVVGQQVVAIGNALGQFQNTVTTGIISGLGRPITASDGSAGGESLSNLLQTDAAINPGNSGGPLVNLAGQVIGINTAVAGEAQNIGFAIPINEVKSLITSVSATGRISRPYLGVRYVQITADFATRNNLKVNDGAYIIGDQNNLAVLPGSPAAKVGIQSGDIITKIDGKTIDKNNSLQSLVADKKPGDKVDLELLRGNDTKKLSVTLDEAPAH